MVSLNARVFSPLLAALAAVAVPVDDVGFGSARGVGVARDAAAITAMSSVQVDGLTPYTYYASAGFCDPSVTKTWTCGANCNANSGFEPIASGGDGSTTQFCSQVFLYSAPLAVVLTFGLVRVCWL